jgi:hypothetical protein
MAQNFRDMLANRRFAIPLIGLLGVCFIGLLLLGFVFILPSLKSDTGRVAEVPATEAAAAPAATKPPSAAATVPPNTPTPKPTPTLVPVGTAVESAAGGAATAPVTTGSTGTTASVAAATQLLAEVVATPEGGSGDQLNPTPQAEEEELAQTGIGWGLILFSGVGLALVAIAARRLRLAS